MFIIFYFYFEILKSLCVILYNSAFLFSFFYFYFAYKHENRKFIKKFCRTILHICLSYVAVGGE
ncbi:hypothetical protein CHAB381_1470 [Campylobacter hominis ATCC BAA-381]|uniref:Uncharacterized protein n=1 Tax=Campylobacter hominis (strain ATCC BAA-381 / DSM 21671 / CCUG 45161 / LMG 19568 / NCTC 13146 / CH001A) TaxID=360107 RepID=A7I3B5_CAMHC|nr:hypothetical protein CHAB381_1470 [Campylobacter hominis ATCC BAA-381]